MTPKRFLTALAVVVVLAAGAGVYAKLGRDVFMPGANAELSQEEITKLVDDVSKLIMLPEGEEPLVATVLDVDALVAEQPFYAGAKNGDILLIYPQTAKAILYSPSRDMLVNVGPIIIDQNAQAQQDQVSDASDSVPPEAGE